VEVGKFISPNQVRKLISKGMAPKSIEAIGTEGRMAHIHFKEGSALYFDGQWKHGYKKLTNKEIEFIKSIGWNLPRSLK